MSLRAGWFIAVTLLGMTFVACSETDPDPKPSRELPVFTPDRVEKIVAATKADSVVASRVQFAKALQSAYEEAGFPFEIRTLSRCTEGHDYLILESPLIVNSEGPAFKDPALEEIRPSLINNRAAEEIVTSRKVRDLMKQIDFSVFIINGANFEAARYAVTLVRCSELKY